jgi:hypothetical protein
MWEAPAQDYEPMIWAAVGTDLPLLAGAVPVGVGVGGFARNSPLVSSHFAYDPEPPCCDRCLTVKIAGDIGCVIESTKMPHALLQIESFTMTRRGSICWPSFWDGMGDEFMDFVCNLGHSLPSSGWRAAACNVNYSSKAYHAFDDNVTVKKMIDRHDGLGFGS